MQIQTKYKSVFKKYRKSEIEKYNNIAVEIQRSDRVDHVDVGLFMHTRAVHKKQILEFWQ